jgi:hypothetical protein
MTATDWIMQAHEHLSIGGYESNQRPYRIGKGEKEKKILPFPPILNDEIGCNI